MVEFSYMGLMFEWDSDKESLVFSEHKITLQEASSVFVDDYAVTIADTRFDDYEQRYITVGMSHQARLLVVAWTQRNNNIRLITAIKAEKRHANLYQRGR